MAFVLFTKPAPYIEPPNSFFRRAPHCSHKLHTLPRRKFHRPQLDTISSALTGRCNSVPDHISTTPNAPEEAEYVEVFGIGSRKEAVLDFCLNSPFALPAFRFWSIVVKDSSKVQLQQRFSNQEILSRAVEALSKWWPCPKAVVLVASAAYGSDNIAALDILGDIKSEKCLVVAIILRPFSFEGQRRQDEVKYLVDILEKQVDFYIDIDTNRLLDNDFMTLDEALKTSNNAVLMAINAISILTSETHIKLQHALHDGGRELKAAEVQKILKDYKEAKIGFGAGFNIKSSVLQAVYDCPSLGIGVKDSGGIIICILASSGIIDYQDDVAFLQVIRLMTGCKEIIASTVCEQKLEPNLIRTTIIAFGCTEQQPSKKIGIFSRLVQHFPFIFNILKKQSPQTQNTKESDISQCQHISEEISLEEFSQLQSIENIDGASEDLGVHVQEVAPLFDNSDEDASSFRSYESSSDGSDIEFSSHDSYPSTYPQDAKGHVYKEELFTRIHLGPSNPNLQVQTQEESADMDATLVPDGVSVYRLPVGVKCLELSPDCPTYSNHHRKRIKEDSRKVLSDTTSTVSWDDMGGRGLEPTVSFNSYLESAKGNHVFDPNKQGILSSRAASMLEAERDSPNKKWSPVLEIQYRGGIYRGRIQGGLPEGKGRLSLGDGSIYDGMWRFGKRSGPGTLYFKNGDVFQGLWRNDVMHGKGWFYFHTGDRWFVNFWKGKANGEGRFYSVLGDVFFGDFKDGWRHGQFLCIGVDGTRFREVWEEGVLVSRKQLDPDGNDPA